MSDRLNDAERLARLIESVGLKAPRIGDLYADAWPLLADAVEKLVAVAEAAKEFLKRYDEVFPIEETEGATRRHLRTALAALEFK